MSVFLAAVAVLTVAATVAACLSDAGLGEVCDRLCDPRGR